MGSEGSTRWRAGVTCLTRVDAGDQRDPRLGFSPPSGSRVEIVIPLVKWGVGKVNHSAWYS